MSRLANYLEGFGGDAYRRFLLGRSGTGAPAPFAARRLASFGVAVCGNGPFGHRGR